MSLLWRKHAVVIGNQVSLHCRGKGAHYLQEAIACADHDGLHALGAFMQSVSIARSPRVHVTDVVLAYPHVHHLLLPWHDGILSPADRQAYARSTLEKQFEVSAGDWICDFAWQGFGSTAIVCAIPRKHFDLVAAACSAHRLRMPRIGSLLVDAISVQPLCRESSALYMVRHAAYCEFALRRAGQWQGLLVLPGSGLTIGQLVLAACASTGDFPDVVRLVDLIGKRATVTTYRLSQMVEGATEQAHVPG